MESLNLLALPHHGKPQKIRRQLQKRSTGIYHFSRERQGWVCHYSSDTPGEVRCEWVIDTLLAKGVVNPDDSYRVVEALESEEGNLQRYQCIVVQDGAIHRAWVQTDTDWSTLLLVGALRTVVIGDVPALEGETVQWSPDDTLPLFSDYALQKPTPWRKRVALMVGVVALIGGVMMFPLLFGPKTVVSVSAPTPKATEKTPWTLKMSPQAQYRFALQKSVRAEQSMQQALYLAAYLTLLPPGWESDGITFEGSEIRTSLTRSPSGLRSVLDALLASYPQMTRFTTLSPHGVTISVPVTTGMPDWYDHILPLSPSWQQLQDTLTLMGFELEVMPSDGGSGEQASSWGKVQWTVVHPTLRLGMLDLLNNELVKLPVSVDSLSMTPVGLDAWDTTFTLTLYGGQ